MYHWGKESGASNWRYLVPRGTNRTDSEGHYVLELEPPIPGSSDGSFLFTFSLRKWSVTIAFVHHRVVRRGIVSWTLTTLLMPLSSQSAVHTWLASGISVPLVCVSARVMQFASLWLCSMSWNQEQILPVLLNSALAVQGFFASPWILGFFFFLVMWRVKSVIGIFMGIALNL